MNKFLKFKECDGFTLIEILAAIFIIGIAIVPMLNYFTNSIVFVKETEIRSQAVTIAGDAVEIIRDNAKDNWDNLDTVVDEFTIGDISAVSSDYDFITTFNINGELYSFDFDGNGAVTTADDDIGRQLEITVSWDSGNKEEVITTLIRNSGDDSE